MGAAFPVARPSANQRSMIFALSAAPEVPEQGETESQIHVFADERMV
jgi:hypothetical protein